MTTAPASARPAWLDRLPDGVVDPHIHQWDPLTTTREVSREATLFRRFERVPRPLARLLPRAKREFVGDPTHVLKPYLPQTYAADAGVDPLMVNSELTESKPRFSQILRVSPACSRPSTPR